MRYMILMFGDPAQTKACPHRIATWSPTNIKRCVLS